MNEDHEVRREFEPLSPPYGEIRERLEDGKIIPFLGAGASLGTRPDGQPWMGDKPPPSFVPSGSELAGYLAEKTHFPEGEPRDLAKVAQYYDVTNGRDLLTERLHSIFDASFPVPTLHHYLAALPKPQLIVTTNYDDLIERAFSARKPPYDEIPYDVIVHTSDPDLGNSVLWRKHESNEVVRIAPNLVDIDLTKTTVIYKIHGAVNRMPEGAKDDQYVITEDDYIDFIARMTRGQTIPAIFAEPFRSRPFLFLGYSLYDWNLRVVWSRIHKDIRSARKIKSWAIQKDPKPLERRLWQAREVEIYNMSIDDFLRKLSDKEPPESPEAPGILAIAS
jgi:hypothetical protein